jgi:hypothetical protein
MSLATTTLARVLVARAMTELGITASTPSDHPGGTADASVVPSDHGPARTTGDQDPDQDP